MSVARGRVSALLEASCAVESPARAEDNEYGANKLAIEKVLLLSADTVFRRLTGSRVLAGIAATLVSSALFVLAHGLTSTLDVSAIVSLGAVALVTSTIVLVQRRLWTAIVVHAVFNVTFVILQLAGSLGTAGAPALS